MSLILRSTLSNTAAITSPLVGIAGENLYATPAYAPCKYNDGATCPKTHNSQQVIVWNRGRSASLKIPAEGGIGGWYKPDGWSINGSVVSDGLFHRLFNFGTTSGEQQAWILVQNGVGIRFVLAQGGSDILDVTDQTINADTAYYISMAWSTSLSLIKAYINNVEVGSRSHTRVLTGTQGDFFSVGARYYGGDTSNGFGGEIENISLYDDYHTDWELDMLDGFAYPEASLPIGTTGDSSAITLGFTF